MNMNTDLDLYEALRLTLDSVDMLAADALRRSGSIESQKAEGLAHRARRVLDALAATAIAKAG